MTRPIVSTLGCLSAGFFLALWAQTEADYVKCMKEAGAVCQRLKKNLDSNSLDAASKDASKLAGNFKWIEGFWASKNASDAVGLAQKAQSAAKEVAAAASAGNQEQANAAFKTLTSVCGPCHNAHREKLPDGTYKIKH